MLNERLKTGFSDLKDTQDVVVDDLKNHKLEFIKTVSHIKGDFKEFKDIVETIEMAEERVEEAIGKVR